MVQAYLLWNVYFSSVFENEFLRRVVKGAFKFPLNFEFQIPCPTAETIIIDLQRSTFSRWVWLVGWLVGRTRRHKSVFGWREERGRGRRWKERCKQLFGLREERRERI